MVCSFKIKAGGNSQVSAIIQTTGISSPILIIKKKTSLRSHFPHLNNDKGLLITYKIKYINYDCPFKSDYVDISKKPFKRITLFCLKTIKKASSGNMHAGNVQRKWNTRHGK